MKWIKPLKDDYLFHEVEFVGGSRLHIMHKMGISFCTVYRYEDSTDKLYIESLHVDDNHRNDGYGKELLNIASNIGDINNCNQLFLWCYINEWVYDWYLRLGFEYYYPNSDVDNAVWLVKNL